MKQKARNTRMLIKSFFLLLLFYDFIIQEKKKEKKDTNIQMLVRSFGVYVYYIQEKNKNKRHKHEDRHHDTECLQQVLSSSWSEDVIYKRVLPSSGV